MWLLGKFNILVRKSITVACPVTCIVAHYRQTQNRSPNHPSVPQEPNISSSVPAPVRLSPIFEFEGGTPSSEPEAEDNGGVMVPGEDFERTPLL